MKRRRFLKDAALAGVGLGVTRTFLGKERQTASNSAIKTAKEKAAETRSESEGAMVRPGSYEEIMRRSSTHVDDYTMSLQFPACDFSGYFLFSALSGDGPCQAVNVGVHVGLGDGAEAGVPQWVRDPYKNFVITSVICDGKSYRSLDDTSYTRGDIIYSRQGLDLQVADVVRVRGSWPYIEMYFLDKRYEITYELEGRAGYVNWLPDHIFTHGLYSYVCFPDFRFHGTITVKGVQHRVEGVGGFDHITGRCVGSPSCPGVGYWHYDPILWSDGHISNGLFFLGRDGTPYCRTGVMTLPDGGYHPSKFTVEYLELGEGTANAGSGGPPQTVPRRWRARMEGSHGTLTYTTTPMEVSDPSGARLIEPNVVFHAAGEFRGRSGEVLKLTGKGFNEFMGAALKPTLSGTGSPR